MTQVLGSLLAALLGVIIDRLSAVLNARRAQENASTLETLKKRRAVDMINARIDREIADEPDLGRLLDRL
jgi:hypothetical protein